MDPAALVRARTRLAPVPFVPEIVLHLVDEVVPLWEDLAASNRGAPVPFWATPWAGGLALARHVLDRPACVRGRRVLDLGCGSGLVAIAAARAGAAAVRAVDVDPLAIEAARANAAANGVAIDVEHADLLEPGTLAPEEVILAGDVFYEEPLAARATAFLRAHAALGRVVLAGDPGRRYAPRDRVAVVAVHDVPTSGGVERAATCTATVVSIGA